MSMFVPLTPNSGGIRTSSRTSKNQSTKADQVLRLLTRKNQSRETAFAILNNLVHTHKSSMRQGGEEVVSPEARQATAILHRLVQVSVDNSRLAAMLSTFARDRAETVLGTSKPEELIGKPDTLGRSIEELAPLEWHLLLHGRSDKAATALRQRIVDSYRQSGEKDGRVELMGQNDRTALVRYLDPTSTSRPAPQKTTLGSMRNRLFNDLTLNNSLLQRLLLGDLPPEDVRNVVGLLLETQGAGVNPQMKVRGGIVLANLIHMVDGARQEARQSIEAALRAHAVSQFAAHFGTDKINDPQLKALVTDKTVGRLTPQEWFWLLRGVTGRKASALRKHVVDLLKAGGASETSLRGLVTGKASAIARSIEPGVGQQLAVIAPAPGDEEKLARRQWAQELLLTDGWKEHATALVTDDSISGDERATVLDRLSELAEGDARTFLLYGGETQGSEAGISLLVLRAREILSGLVARARKNKALLGKLQDYGNRRYSAELIDLVRNRATEKSHEVRREYLRRLSPLALFYALSLRQDRQYDERAGDAHEIALDVGGSKNAPDGRKYLYRAFEGNKIAELLKYYRNDDAHYRRLRRNMDEFRQRPGTTKSPVKKQTDTRRPSAPKKKTAPGTREVPSGEKKVPVTTKRSGLKSSGRKKDTTAPLEPTLKPVPGYRQPERGYSPYYTVEEGKKVPNRNWKSDYADKANPFYGKASPEQIREVAEKLAPHDYDSWDANFASRDRDKAHEVGDRNEIAGKDTPTENASDSVAAPSAQRRKPSLWRRLFRFGRRGR